MSSKHSEKALATLADMGTDGKDWYHPPVRWEMEKRWLLTEVSCPDCKRQNLYRETYYAASDIETSSYGPNKEHTVKSVRPGARAYQWPEAMRRTMHEYSSREAMASFVAVNGLVKMPCQWCTGGRYAQPTGLVKEPRLVDCNVGYLMWPEGAVEGSRFAITGQMSKSRWHCQLCAKGINKSLAVPLAHKKDGKLLKMFVGSDCARKFTAVAKLAQPGKDHPNYRLPFVFDETYADPREVVVNGEVEA